MAPRLSASVSLTLALSVCLAFGLPLECHREASDDQDGEASIICQFRLKEPLAGSQFHKLGSICLDEDESSRTSCINGEVRLKTTRNFAASSKDAGEETSSTPEIVSKDNPSTLSTDEVRTLLVGRATYDLPYTQHGARVAPILSRAPTDDAPPQKWIDWYVQLAGAHYPTAGQDPSDDEVWVQVELTINAYQTAKRTLEDLEAGGSASFENRVLLASVAFHLGEAFSLDPQMQYADQATKAFETSHARFESILQSSTLHAKERAAIESKYAEACTKLGIALFSSLDPMETVPAWARNMMASMDPDGGAQQEEASSGGISSLEKIQDYLLEAIRIFERHFEDEGQEDKNEDNDDSSIAPTLWSRLITPQELKVQFAVALQQLATIYAMEGHFSKAKKRFEQALQLQYDMLSATNSGVYYQQDSEYTQTSIADLHLSFSDTCLQLGDYPCAKEQYGKAMSAHARHNIRVAPMMPVEADAEVDAAMQEAVGALEDYRVSVEGSTGGSTYRRQHGLDSPYDADSGSDGYVYAKDDGYEADLLASLGTMYLSLGDEQAVSYLEEARDLYSGLKEDRESAGMADLLINLAMAYYRNYEFEKSKETQWQALDLYQKMFGDGVNPYMQLLDVGGGSAPPAEDGDDSRGSSKADSDSSVGNKAQASATSKTIDLESFQQSIQNATDSSNANREIKEEL